MQKLDYRENYRIYSMLNIFIMHMLLTCSGLLVPFWHTDHQLQV